MPDSTNEIACIYIAVHSDVDGDETVLTTTVPPFGRLPIVAIDAKGLRHLHSYAQQQADATGDSISILSFTVRKLYGTVRPSTTGGNR